MGCSIAGTYRHVNSTHAWYKRAGRNTALLDGAQSPVVWAFRYTHNKGHNATPLRKGLNSLLYAIARSASIVVKTDAATAKLSYGCS